MTLTRAANRPRVRLIWDELLSHRVPRALRELGFNTTYVGATSDGAPPRRSSDAVVIEFARRTNQVIVTSNHDMMLLCDEAGQRFVWMDPRGRQSCGRSRCCSAFDRSGAGSRSSKAAHACAACGRRLSRSRALRPPVSLTSGSGSYDVVSGRPPDAGQPARTTSDSRTRLFAESEGGTTVDSDDNIETEHDTRRLADTLRAMPDVGSDDDFAAARDLESPTTDRDEWLLASIADWGAIEDWSDWAETAG